METNEFRIDKHKILTKEYKLESTNPGNAIEYTRNSLGNIMVDSNNTNIDSQRLVINLVNTRYELISFNNVLDTNFSEFLDPEITVLDEQQLNSSENLSGTVLDLQNQVNTKDSIINNLQQTVESLSNTINSINASSVSQSIDVAGTVKDAIEAATKQDNKKPRIFSDGTLIRDKDRFAYFYIIEDGKKRFFNFNEELLNITAKSLGKVTATGGPDLINVSQQVIDDIPSGAPFTNFDLVKNVKTPPPPPLDLKGKRLAADWIYPDGKGKTPDNPIVIEVSNAVPANNKLILDLQIQADSAEGIVNAIEVWDWAPVEPQWFNGKPTLPIKDGNSTNDNDYKSFTSVGFSSGMARVKVILKNTRSAISPTGPGNGFAYADRYTPISLSIQNPEFNMALAPKIFNDSNDEYFAEDKKLYVKVKYIISMPDVVNKTETDARTAILATGIPTSNIQVVPGPRISTASLFNKIVSSDPIKNTYIDKNTQVKLVKYLPGDITFNSGILINRKFPDFIRLLKSYGFVNLQVGSIYRSTFWADHLDVYKFSANGRNIPLSFTNNTIPWDANFIIDLRIETSRLSYYYRNFYKNLTEQQIITEFNQLISTL